MPLDWSNFRKDPAPKLTPVPAAPAGGRSAKATGGVDGQPGTRNIRGDVDAAVKNVAGRASATAKLYFKENFTVNEPNNPAPMLRGTFVVILTSGKAYADPSSSAEANSSFSGDVTFYAHEGEDDTVELFRKSKAWSGQESGGAFNTADTSEVPKGDRSVVQTISPIAVTHGKTYTLVGEVELDVNGVITRRDPDNAVSDSSASAEFGLSTAQVVLWVT